MKVLVSANIPTDGLIEIYSPHTWKECRFGQRHGLQSLTLTSYFYINIYPKVIYLYFYEGIFQDKSIHMVFIFWNSKSYSWFIFPIFGPNLIQNNIPFEYGGSTYVIFKSWRYTFDNVWVLACCGIKDGFDSPQHI